LDPAARRSPARWPASQTPADLKALNDELKDAAAESRAAIQRDIERVKKQIKATLAGGARSIEPDQ